MRNELGVGGVTSPNYRAVFGTALSGTDDYTLHERSPALLPQREAMALVESTFRSRNPDVTLRINGDAPQILDATQIADRNQVEATKTPRPEQLTVDNTASVLEWSERKRRFYADDGPQLPNCRLPQPQSADSNQVEATKTPQQVHCAEDPEDTPPIDAPEVDSLWLWDPTIHAAVELVRVRAVERVGRCWTVHYQAFDGSYQRRASMDRWCEFTVAVGVSALVLLPSSNVARALQTGAGTADRYSLDGNQVEAARAAFAGESPASASEPRLVVAADRESPGGKPRRFDLVVTRGSDDATRVASLLMQSADQPNGFSEFDLLAVLLARVQPRTRAARLLLSVWDVLALSQRADAQPDQ